MKIVLGLGNPGSEYQQTRHNLGFRVLDEASHAWGAALKADAVMGAQIGQAQCFGQEVVLAKPMTFMNASGQAAARIVERYKVPAKDLIVVLDDIALPLGVLRIRRKGSGGGHNGLISIIEELGTQEFVRVRLGVGAEGLLSKDWSEYVLSAFSKKQEKVIGGVIQQAKEALEVLLTKGLHQAMNRYNTKGV